MKETFSEYNVEALKDGYRNYKVFKKEKNQEMMNLCLRDINQTLQIDMGFENVELTHDSIEHIIDAFIRE